MVAPISWDLRLFLALAAAGWEGLGAHVERSVEVVERIKEEAARTGMDASPMTLRSRC